MDRWRAAGALLALAACIASSAAAPTASNHTALDLYDGAPEGCYYNFQRYGEGDRIMTNEPCLNCTCHNRMLMCYLRVCPFTKPIGQDCTVEKRADQCCPIVTCPDVPVDLLTSTSTNSPAEYGATGLGRLDKYGCSIHGKYFPEGSKVPPTPNKPCEHCYCIRNMTTCVMQECTLHVDGCTPIYHKDVCCPVRYSCDHPEDEIPLLDDMTTTVRPTPGFLLTTTTVSPVTQMTQDCVHDDQVFPDGALIKTEKACEHCYCMKGDIVCVVQECGTPMENEGKNCTSLAPREGQCCPDTYICEGDDLPTGTPFDITTEQVLEELTTTSPPRRVAEGSGYRNEPDDSPHVEGSSPEPEIEGSGDDQPVTDIKTEENQTPAISSEPFVTTEIEPISSSTKTSLIEEIEEGTPAIDLSAEHDTTNAGILKEDITKAYEYGSSTTVTPILEEVEKSTAEPIEMHGTISEQESSDLDQLIPVATTASIMVEPEKDTTEVYDGHDISVTTPEVKAEEKFTTEQLSSTSIAPAADNVEGQHYKPDDINETETLEPDQLTSFTTIRPIIDIAESEPTTQTEQDVDSKKDIHKLDTPSTHVPILEDSDVYTTETSEDQDISNFMTEKESIEPDEHIPISTSGPQLEDGTQSNIIPDAAIDKDISDFDQFIPISTNSPSTSRPLKEVYTSTTTENLLEESDKTTMELNGKDESTLTTIMDKDNSDSETYVPRTTITPVVAGEEPITLPEQEQNVISETQTTPVPEIEKITVRYPSADSIIKESSTETSRDDTEPTSIIDEKDFTEEDMSVELEHSTPFIPKDDQISVTTDATFRKEDNNEPADNLNKESELIVSPVASAAPPAVTETQSPMTAVTDESVTLQHQEPTESSFITQATPSHKDSEPTFTTNNKLETPETTTINIGDNEIDEEFVKPPGRIPGEGDCLLDGTTYRNESVVPSTNKCHTSCKCLSSIIKCDPIICSPPPEYMNNCQSIYDSPDSCCPTYVCDHSRETVPPESQSQMSGTEKPVPSTSIECRGDQCEIIKEESLPPINDQIAVAKPCQGDDCEVASLPEVIPESSVKPCEGDNCYSISDITPAPEIIQVPIASCEGDNCGVKSEKPLIPEVIKESVIPCVGDSCDATPDKIHVPEVSEGSGIPCEGDGCVTTSDQKHISEIPKETLEPCEGGSCDTTSDKVEVPDVPGQTVKPCEGDSCVTTSDKGHIPEAPKDTVKPCEGESCDATSDKDHVPEVPEKSVKPCQGDSCGDTSDMAHIPEVPEVSVKPCEGDICDAKSDKDNVPEVPEKSVKPCQGDSCGPTSDMAHIPEVPEVSVKPCEGDSCDVTSDKVHSPEDPVESVKPCEGISCDTTSDKVHISEVPEESVKPCEGDSCGAISDKTHIPEALDESVKPCEGESCDATSNEVHVPEAPVESVKPCDGEGCDITSDKTHMPEVPEETVKPCEGEGCGDSSDKAHIPKITEESMKPCEGDSCDTTSDKAHISEVPKESVKPCDGDSCGATSDKDQIPEAPEESMKPCEGESCDATSDKTHIPEVPVESVKPCDGDSCDDTSHKIHIPEIPEDSVKPCEGEGCDATSDKADKGSEAENPEATSDKATVPEATLDNSPETEIPEATSDKAPENEIPEATSDKAPKTDVPEATTHEVTVADVPEATLDKSPDTEIPEHTSHKAPETEIPEATSDKALNTDVPEATTDKATVPGDAETTSDKAPETEIIEATTNMAPKFNVSEATSGEASVPEVPEPTLDKSPESEIPKPSSDKATEPDVTESTSDKPSETETPEATSEKVSVTEIPEAISDKVPDSEILEATTEKTPDTENPEATSDKALATEIPEATSVRAPETEIPEATSDKAPNTDVPEATTHEATVADVPEATLDKSPETEIPEHTSDKAPETEIPETTSNKAPEAEVTEAISDEGPKTEIPEVTFDKAPDTENLEATSDKAPVTEIPKVTSDKATVTEVPESTLDKSPETEIPETTSDKAPDTEIPEGTSEKTPETEVTEAISDERPQTEIPEVTSDKAEAYIPEATSEKAPKTEVPEATSDKAHVSEASGESVKPCEGQDCTITDQFSKPVMPQSTTNVEDTCNEENDCQKPQGMEPSCIGSLCQSQATSVSAEGSQTETSEINDFGDSTTSVPIEEQTEKSIEKQETHTTTITTSILNLSEISTDLLATTKDGAFESTTKSAKPESSTEINITQEPHEMASHTAVDNDQTVSPVSQDITEAPLDAEVKPQGTVTTSNQDYTTLQDYSTTVGLNENLQTEKSIEQTEISTSSHKTTEAFEEIPSNVEQITESSDSEIPTETDTSTAGEKLEAYTERVPEIDSNYQPDQLVTEPSNENPEPETMATEDSATESNKRIPELKEPNLTESGVTSPTTVRSEEDKKEQSATESQEPSHLISEKEQEMYNTESPKINVFDADRDKNIQGEEKPEGPKNDITENNSESLVTEPPVSEFPAMVDEKTDTSEPEHIGVTNILDTVTSQKPDYVTDNQEDDEPKITESPNLKTTEYDLLTTAAPVTESDIKINQKEPPTFIENDVQATDSSVTSTESSKDEILDDTLRQQTTKPEDSSSESSEEPMLEPSVPVTTEKSHINTDLTTEAILIIKPLETTTVLTNIPTLDDSSTATLQEYETEKTVLLENEPPEHYRPDDTHDDAIMSPTTPSQEDSETKEPHTSKHEVTSESSMPSDEIKIVLPETPNDQKEVTETPEQGITSSLEPVTKISESLNTQQPERDTTPSNIDNEIDFTKSPEVMDDLRTETPLSLVTQDQDTIVPAKGTEDDLSKMQTSTEGGATNSPNEKETGEQSDISAEENVEKVDTSTKYVDSDVKYTTEGAGYESETETSSITEKIPEMVFDSPSLTESDQPISQSLETIKYDTTTEPSKKHIPDDEHESAVSVEQSDSEITPKPLATDMEKPDQEHEQTVPDLLETTEVITEKGIEELEKNTESSVEDTTENRETEPTKTEDDDIILQGIPANIPVDVTKVTEIPSELTESDTTLLPEQELTSVKYETTESTPYLIELQEHTHINNEESTTVIDSPEDVTTKSPEHEQTIPELSSNKLTTSQPEETYLHEDEIKLPVDVESSSEEYQPTSTGPEVAYDKSTQSTVSVSDDLSEQQPTTVEQQITTLSFVTSTESSPIQDSEIAEPIDQDQEKPAKPVASFESTTTIKSSPESDEKSTTTAASIDKYTKPEDKIPGSSTAAPEIQKPEPNEIQPTEEISSPDDSGHFAPSGTNAYGQEPDYFEDDQTFGPGTCRYGGKVYVSAQQIPRDDPCDFCFCFRSDIICLQQSCPPPIHGCHEEPIQGFCCPRYECPVSMATTLNVTTTTTTTTTTLPPNFPTHSYKGAAQRRGCQIKGHTYKVGEVVRASSGPCLHCTCGGDGQMKCDPKACTPEPMLRQMIAAAVSAKRRR